jgi:hypothetical protein
MAGFAKIGERPVIGKKIQLDSEEEENSEDEE